jgi:phenylacetate-CoA ligase
MIILDSFDMTNEKMFDYYRQFQKYRPKIIIAYANSIYLFARFLKENNLRPVKLNGIISSAEKLSADKRKLIEEVFGCRVFDRYGSREVGLIASECEEHEGMHINMDGVFVEFIRNGKPCKENEPGNITVTDLYNYAMPLIRYDTGDIGSFTDKKCSCERGFPLMNCVEGRTADFIIINEKMIHGEYFTHLFYGVRGIKQFQLIQETENYIIVRIVKDKDLDIADIMTIKNKIKEFCGEDMNVCIDFVDKIPLPKSGKFMFTISKVKPEV